MKRGYKENEPLYKRLLFVSLHLIYRYEQRNERPKRNTVVFVIPFNSQSLLTGSTVSFSDSAKRITGFNTMINRSSLHIIHCIRVFS